MQSFQVLSDPSPSFHRIDSLNARFMLFHKVCVYPTTKFFFPFVRRETTFVTPCLFLWARMSFQNGLVYTCTYFFHSYKFYLLQKYN